MTQVLKAIDGNWRAVEVIYAVFANNDFDGVQEGVMNTLRHMHDLQDMECENVTAFRITAMESVDAWEAADKIEEIARVKSFGRKGMIRVREEMAEEGKFITIEIVSPRSLTTDLIRMAEAQKLEF